MHLTNIGSAKGDSSTKILGCEICGSSKKNIFKKCGKFTYYKCQVCEVVYVHPIKPQKFYLDTKTYLHDMELYISRINPYGQRWIAEQFERMYEMHFGDMNRGKVLEIGSGVGFLELVLLARGWEVHGVETSGQAVEFGRMHYKVDIEQTTIESYSTDVRFDAFVMIEVLEHFVNPSEAIQALKKFCKGTTIIFGTTPNTDSLHWQTSEQNIYVPDDHIFLFNECSLRVFADKVGIHDLHVEYFGSGIENDSNLMFAGVISA